MACDDAGDRADRRRFAPLGHEAQPDHAAGPGLFGARQFTVTDQVEQVILQALAIEGIECRAGNRQRFTVQQATGRDDLQ